MEQEKRSYFTITNTLIVFLVSFCVLFFSGWIVSKNFDIHQNALSGYFYSVIVYILNITSVPLAIISFILVVWGWIKIYVYAKRCWVCSCRMCCGRGIEEAVDD